ncbi:MAG: cation transporter [Meiothermus sp.]|nr:cation transporter [Meiothermus sp.]
MDRSVFDIPKMDCAAEESLVRIRLEPVSQVRSLEFDLPARKLTVYHQGGLSEIELALQGLGLGARLVGTARADGPAPEQAMQHQVLWTVLAINFTFFVIELVAGFWSNSMGLVADSLDMLADALVYGLSLFAVGATMTRKKSIARLSGYFQITLAVLGFAEVLRRFLRIEEIPDFTTMLGVSFLALLANAFSLYLLHRSRSKEAHMRASMIFTSNDVIVNIGVMVAALMVAWLDSSTPDLIIGGIVFLVVLRGAFRILQLAK